MFSTYYYNHWDYWELNSKVTFDGEKRLILISPGVVELDVKTDIYSSWKKWVLLRDNLKYPQAIRSVGGDPLPGGQFLGITYFLTNGWRIRTWEGHHTLTIKGNLYTDEGESPFVPTLQPWSIAIYSSVSNIVSQVNSSAGVLTPLQNEKLMSLQNLDPISIIDGVWDKEIAPGITAKDYIVKKLLTTSKFIGLQ